MFTRFSFNSEKRPLVGATSHRGWNKVVQTHVVIAFGGDKNNRAKPEYLEEVNLFYLNFPSRSNLLLTHVVVT